MKWYAKLDESIVVDDIGLRNLLKRADGPGDFIDALCMRFEEAVKGQMSDGVPLMVEFTPARKAAGGPGEVPDKKGKKLLGMTGGM